MRQNTQNTWHGYNTGARVPRRVDVSYQRDGIDQWIVSACDDDPDSGDEIYCAGGYDDQDDAWTAALALAEKLGVSARVTDENGEDVTRFRSRY